MGKTLDIMMTWLGFKGRITTRNMVKTSSICRSRLQVPELAQQEGLPFHTSQAESCSKNGRKKSFSRDPNPYDLEECCRDLGKKREKVQNQL